MSEGESEPVEDEEEPAVDGPEPPELVPPMAPPPDPRNPRTD